MTDRAIGMKAARRIADMVHDIVSLEEAKTNAASEMNAKLKVMKTHLRKATQDIRSGQLGMFEDDQPDQAGLDG